MSFIKYHFIVIIFLFPFSLHTQIPCVDLNEKIKGISFQGPSQPPLKANTFEELKTSNATWVAFIPEAILDRKTLQLQNDEQNDHWSETIDANIIAIKKARKSGLKIMLKPHVVLSEPKAATITSLNIKLPSFLNFQDKTKGAIWRGDFQAASEKDWKLWEKSYETYILNLAQVAESLGVDLFCIGTELRESAVQRVDFWKQLILKVRKIYKGPITYSANWDEYDKITFWKELDFIGIDTYFPISESRIPNVKQTINNWKPILKKLKSVSEKNNRAVLITEYGYRNVAFAGKEPWIHDAGKDKPIHEVQLNLYNAFYQAVWTQPWVAGGFLWQWSHSLVTPDNADFSPQNKPAFKVVQEWYKK